ncbi:MAG: hypothetical protein FWE37_06310 [Spirochaetaceae bacterium]|nr:hypothetical protein [Spirochaetaceae bacterium]
MKQKNYGLFFITIMVLLLSSCYPMPYNSLHFVDEHLAHGPLREEPSRWDSANEIRFILYQETGSVSDIGHVQNTFLRRLEHRDAVLMERYYLNGAFFRARITPEGIPELVNHNIRAPYGITLAGFGFADRHTTFTIKGMHIQSQRGGDFSALAADSLPVTIGFFDYTERDGKPVKVIFDTGRIFNFRAERITIEVILEVNTVEGSETGTIIFEFRPIREAGLFRWFVV